MDDQLKKSGVVSRVAIEDVQLNKDLEVKAKPVAAKKKKRAILISIKDNGFGVASAMATSIPAAYRHTQTRETLKMLYPEMSPRARPKRVRKSSSSINLQYIFKSDSIRKSLA